MTDQTDPSRTVDETSVPDGRPLEVLDVRDAGPPTPLRETLELLTELPAETVLLQRNDRAPQHLYPRLDDRGYEYETVERGGEIRTVIWNPSP